MNGIDDCRSQVQAVHDYFDELALAHRLLPPPAASAANDDSGDRDNSPEALAA
jgi:hypothetical protein